MKIEEVEIDIGSEFQENAGTSNADKVHHVWCVYMLSWVAHQLCLEDGGEAW